MVSFPYYSPTIPISVGILMGGYGNSLGKGSQYWGSLKIPLIFGMVSSRDPKSKAKST